MRELEGYLYTDLQSFLFFLLIIFPLHSSSSPTAYDYFKVLDLKWSDLPLELPPLSIFISSLG